MGIRQIQFIIFQQTIAISALEQIHGNSKYINRKRFLAHHAHEKAEKNFLLLLTFLPMLLLFIKKL